MSSPDLIKCGICGHAWDTHDPAFCPYGRQRAEEPAVAKPLPTVDPYVREAVAAQLEAIDRKIYSLRNIFRYGLGLYTSREFDADLSRTISLRRWLARTRDRPGEGD